MKRYGIEISELLKISIVIVNSPNNPSGAVYSESTIKEMAAIIKEYPEVGKLLLF
jgi:aspartate/methionine/tyrosine aminotransferase